jgi:hypothetical protein
MRWRAPRDPAAGSWREWVRAQPALAAAVLLFCVASVAGLWLTLPEGTMSSGRTRGGGATSAPASPPEAITPRGPAAAAPEAPRGAADGSGPWVWQSASAPSGRGLALAYAYRTRPPGDDSRFDWFVRLVGAPALLDDIDEVVWRMDPPPKDGGDLISRNRARDGFPLMGDGPGGWFGVSALVRYKNGQEETLARRIELPDAEP